MHQHGVPDNDRDDQVGLPAHVKELQPPMCVDAGTSQQEPAILTVENDHGGPVVTIHSVTTFFARCDHERASFDPLSIY